MSESSIIYRQEVTIARLKEMNARQVEKIQQLEADAKHFNETIDLKDARIHGYKETITELRQAIEFALDSLSPYLNANSPYTPDVLEAAGFLNKAYEASETVADVAAESEKPKFTRADIVRIHSGQYKDKLGQLKTQTGFGSDWIVGVIGFQTDIIERYSENDLSLYSEESNQA